MKLPILGIFPWVCVTLIITWLGCAGEQPTGLALTPAGDGPMVVYEPLLEPDPEVPFPSNLATRFTTTTRTGRLLNLSEDSPLSAERELRGQYNELDGFSVFGTITLSFDAPIDLDTVHNDSVVLIDASPESPDFGKLIPLDLGTGYFPINFKVRDMLPYEENADLPDLLFGPENTLEDSRLEHYEVATNTLMIRPVFTLRPQTTYAVVITQDVTDDEGAAVRSPFEGVNHPTHTHPIKGVAESIPGGVQNVAFAWIFSTQSVADDLIALRQGLD